MEGLFFNRDWGRIIEVALSGDGGPEGRTVRVYRGRAQQVMSLNSNTKEDGDRTSPLTFEWNDSTGQLHTQLARITPRGLEFSDNTEDAPNFFMFASMHPIGSVETAGRYSEIRRSGRSDEFTNLLRKEYPWISGSDIEVDAGFPVVYASLRHEKVSRALGNISGGVNRTIAILLAIASRTGSVTIVDEFDAGVFYTHQESIWRTTLSMLRNYEGQLFASTHSAESLRALLRAAGDRVDDIALWRLERDDAGAPVLYQFDGTTLKDALEFGAEARGM